MINISFVFNLILTILSLYFLIEGANWMLNGSINIAKKYKLSPLVIGSTIVAFGTILPSIAVNIAIVFLSPQNMGIAVGNMLGTNYVNLGLALGIPAFITDIVTKFNVFEKEIPLYLGLIGLLTAFAVDGSITPIEGLILLIAYFGISIIVYQYSKREKEEATLKDIDVKDEKLVPITNSIFKIILGLFVLVFASFLLTYSAPNLATVLGIDPYIVGLTVVGIGTSLPTIVASIQAAKKGYIDIVLGNVFGGNIINIGLGIGLPALFHKIGLDSGSVEDIYFTNIYNFVIILLVLMEMKLLGNHKTISRVSGGIIIGVYVLYIVYKVLIIRFVH